MKIFSFKKGPKGRQKGEFALGSVDWQDGLVLKVSDRTLREILLKHFAQPIWVPLPMGSHHEIVGHRWELLQEGEEHFFEALKKLHRVDLFVDLVSES